MEPEMIKHTIRELAGRVPAMLAVGALLAGCASGGSAKPQVKVRVEPVAPIQSGAPSAGTLEQPAPPTVPQVTAAAGPALSAAPERRATMIDIPEGTPLATAVTQIGKQFGVTVNVDPDVRGTTQASMRNVTLEEALSHIVPPATAKYQLQGGVLRVVPIRMESRTFTLDYVAISRVGTMSTVVQRRLSNSGLGGTPGTNTGLSFNAGAAAAASGGDVLTAQSVADVWQDIRVAITGIMQAGQSTSASGSNTAAQAAAGNQAAQIQQGQSSNGPQATSNVFSDGSVLVITPMSGLINVTAMPDRIAAVEKFLDQFQASILRQVMITAKIVEVNLNRTFQYGIDWSVVTGSASNKFGVTLRNDPTTVTTGQAGTVNFTFNGGTTTVNAVLTALESQGNVNVLSNETTTALNNQRAIFQGTTSEVFFNVTRTPLLGTNGGVVSTQSSVIPQQIDVGVVLDVLPQISADNILTMDVRPAVTNIDHVASISLPDGTSASAPVIAKREGDTIARLRAGETMMIGGLVQTRKEHTVGGIPILKDIPFFGRIFRRINETETRSELVVFLTPTIISGQPVAGR
jgi:MSHA type pilus biogenesis protein MshL